MSKIATTFGIHDALKQLGIQDINPGTSTGSNNFSSGDILDSNSPVDGALIAKVKTTSKEDYDKVMEAATSAFKTWKTMPAPQRAERAPWKIGVL
jgi:aldehyde dehydrogenase (NAD+)